ncbi:MAG: hypothetical protein ACWGO1_03645, partial [Anaerolineales bacterium]
MDETPVSQKKLWQERTQRIRVVVKKTAPFLFGVAAALADGQVGAAAARLGRLLGPGAQGLKAPVGTPARGQIDSGLGQVRFTL